MPEQNVSGTIDVRRRLLGFAFRGVFAWRRNGTERWRPLLYRVDVPDGVRSLLLVTGNEAERGVDCTIASVGSRFDL